MDRKYNGEMDNFLYVSSYNWDRDTMVVLANSYTCSENNQNNFFFIVF